MNETKPVVIYFMAYLLIPTIRFPGGVCWHRVSVHVNNNSLLVNGNKVEHNGEWGYYVSVVTLSQSWFK